MRCRTARRRLSDALDGALAGGRRIWLEAHLRGCPDCRAYRERIGLIQDRAKLEDGRPSVFWEEFERAVEARIDAAGERRPSLRAAAVRTRWAWGAAAASVLIGFAAWYLLQRPGRLQVETWTAYADVLDPLMMAADADHELAVRVDREIGAQIEEISPPSDIDALVLPAADPLFWEGLSDEELRGIITALEKGTAQGGPA